MFVQVLPAQRVSRDYRNKPMAEVLRDLDHAATHQRIVFIYNDLEDFTVTERFDSLTIAEAIRTRIGFYPISLTARGESVLLVECTQKKTYKAINPSTETVEPVDKKMMPRLLKDRPDLLERLSKVKSKQRYSPEVILPILKELDLVEGL